VGEEGRGEPEAALVRQGARSAEALRALALAARDELPDLVELRLRVDGADVGVLVERVADAQAGSSGRLSLRHEVVGDALLHEQARARAADVPWLK
jgi:hypothetical protein